MKIIVIGKYLHFRQKTGMPYTFFLQIFCYTSTFPLFCHGEQYQGYTTVFDCSLVE